MLVGAEPFGAAGAGGGVWAEAAKAAEASNAAARMRWRDVIMAMTFLIERSLTKAPGCPGTSGAFPVRICIG